MQIAAGGEAPPVTAQNGRFLSEKSVLRLVISLAPLHLPSQEISQEPGHAGVPTSRLDARPARGLSGAYTKIV
jgi:hypothetical protein